jgi:hypothetical protein
VNPTSRVPLDREETLNPTSKLPLRQAGVTEFD